jgi:hypothetical protein
MKTHRVNITIAAPLHARAKIHAAEVHFTDFSGLVTKLIVADLEVDRKATPVPDDSPAAKLRKAEAFGLHGKKHARSRTVPETARAKA